jgi:DNA invertase Pin-like site-specific DNA recombinase
VSTRGQLDGNSIEDQENLIRQKYPEAKIIIEAYSGAKERVLFNKLLNTSHSNDILVCTKLDRFCRTVKEGLEYIDGLMVNGVSIHILNMGLIENTPMGKLIVTNLLAFAEFERSQIIERCSSGKAIAKQNPNYVEGRPKTYSAIMLQHALSLKDEHSYKQIEQMTGISKSTLIRAQKKYGFSKS